MIGFIISGHGNFATGIMSSLELIAGKQMKIIGIDFTKNLSSEMLREKMEIALEQLNDCEGIIFLTDLLGGSPFKVAAELSMKLKEKNIEVISGTNLGMLLEGTIIRDSLGIEELKNTMILSGKQSVGAYENKKRKQKIVGGI